MPATFAHYLFGQRVLEKYPAELRDCAEGCKELFDTGLQGPDLLFFFKPLKKTDISDVGYALHDESGRLFFDNAVRAVNCADGGERARRLAYALGFICHYSLDVACHGYIEKKIAASGCSHYAIEKEFDKYFARKCGLDPFKADISCGICRDKRAADSIAPFFNGLKEGFAPISRGDIAAAQGGFVFYNRAMQGRSAPMRAAVNAVFAVARLKKKLGDMLYSRTDNPACEDSNLRLEKLAAKAESACLERTKEFIEAAEGRGELSALFDPTFGPADGWQDIPVLTTEEELRYEV